MENNAAGEIRFLNKAADPIRKIKMNPKLKATTAPFPIQIFTFNM